MLLLDGIVRYCTSVSLNLKNYQCFNGLEFEIEMNDRYMFRGKEELRSKICNDWVTGLNL
jgi:hypothetical protein